ncbi:DUF1801 domain-containing protein [Roseateles sp.]|uniref:DUF1801 domain-containing protein n=1 Tax=Roseateles sp. TaxID=1971397 RepID=UPI0039E83F5A
MPQLTAADTPQAVDRFIAALDHPFKAEIAALRRAILEVDPAIAEGIKWNAPSWRTTDYFATTHLRDKSCLGLILHLGAKARTLPDGGLDIPDPTGLLKWLGKDRAKVEFHSADDLAAKLPALQAILRMWIGHL